MQLTPLRTPLNSILLALAQLVADCCEYSILARGDPSATCTLRVEWQMRYENYIMVERG